MSTDATVERPSPAAAPAAEVTPARIYDMLQAYRQAAALNTAIELDIFSIIAAGRDTVPAMAAALGLPQRGLRILCDFLVTERVLDKSGGAYSMAPDVAAFLDRASPRYIGAVARFVRAQVLRDAFDELTATVRRGGAVASASFTPPHWVDFARVMGGLQTYPATVIADTLALPADRPIRVLDVAASHGQFGIAIARRFPQATIVALDWPEVLSVTSDNAVKAGIATRFQTIAGDARRVELADGYDALLAINFLHHFGRTEAVELLTRARRALAPSGTIVIAGLIPNADGVSPPAAARFNLSILASTVEGEVHTTTQLAAMLNEAGFSDVQERRLPQIMHTMISAVRTA